MLDVNYELRDDPIYDTETGYAINYPLGPQDYPGWQNDFPDVITRINQIRSELRIYVADDKWEQKPDVWLRPVDALAEVVAARGIELRVAEMQARKARAKGDSSMGSLTANIDPTSNQE